MKIKRIVAVLLLLVAILGLSGCGENKRIKEACEAETNELINQMSYSILTNLAASSAGVISSNKTTVDYNSKDESFTCKAYVTMSINPLYQNTNLFKYYLYLYEGHMDKGSVIIDDFDLKEIPKYN